MRSVVVLLFVVLAGGAAANPGQPPGFALAYDTVHFVGAEMLGRPTDHSVTVNVVPRCSLEVYFEYGGAPGAYGHQTATQASAPLVPVEAVLSGLWPDTRCYYRTRYRTPGSGTFLAGTEGSFHTARRNGDAFTFAVEGDPHMLPNEQAVESVFNVTLANVAAANPDFMVDMGDNFMLDKWQVVTPDTILKRLLQYRRWWDQVCGSMPLFLVLGNHEGEQGWDLNGTPNSLPVQFTNARKVFYPNPVPDGFYSGDTISQAYVDLREDYYSWEWANALFVVLDPYWYTNTKPNNGEENWYWTLGRDQYDWLKRTLEGSQAKFKFLFIHHLVGGKIDATARGGSEYSHYYEWGGQRTDSTWGFDAMRPGWGVPIHQLLIDNHVDIMFHGHDHFYAKQDTDGIVYQMAPQPAQVRWDSIPGQAANYGYVSGTLIGSRGYIRVTVDDTSATVAYVRTFMPSETTSTRHNGDIAHSYTIVKRDTWPSGWREVASMPLVPSGRPVKAGGWLSFDAGADRVYAAKGNKTGDFCRYDTYTGTWQTLASMPVGTEGRAPEKGASGAADGDNWVYATKGNNTQEFWRYGIARDSWYQLANVPLGPTNKKVKGGTDLAFLVRNDTGWVYMLKGYKTEFWRYNTVSGAWQQLADAPAGARPKWDKGSFIVHDGDNYIYAHKAKYHELWRYNVALDSWSTASLAPMPYIGKSGSSKKSKDGGSGAWFERAIWCLKGGNTQEFWTYYPDANTWVENDTMPSVGSTGRKRRVSYGADIVVADRALWALKGNKTVEFWRYGLSTGTYRDGGTSCTTRDASGVLRLAPLPGVARFPATIGFETALPGRIQLKVYDLTGAEVVTLASGFCLPGRHSVAWSGADSRGRRVGSGIYFVQLASEGLSAIKRVTLMR